ncbi:hypothetical protein PUN28_010064 [Cardiocondyla obscurior]|uniref:Uncharacterized protein n=1 Tax=Cardiocondyla obscurior TaxID=286306 RepID=A0AAW2FRS9_9HYME
MITDPIIPSTRFLRKSCVIQYYLLINANVPAISHWLAHAQFAGCNRFHRTRTCERDSNDCECIINGNGCKIFRLFTPVQSAMIYRSACGRRETKRYRLIRLDLFKVERKFAAVSVNRPYGNAKSAIR